MEIPKQDYDSAINEAKARNQVLIDKLERRRTQISPLRQIINDCIENVRPSSEVLSKTPENPDDRI